MQFLELDSQCKSLSEAYTSPPASFGVSLAAPFLVVKLTKFWEITRWISYFSSFIIIGVWTELCLWPRIIVWGHKSSGSFSMIFPKGKYLCGIRAAWFFLWQNNNSVIQDYILLADGVTTVICCWGKVLPPCLKWK